MRRAPPTPDVLWVPTSRALVRVRRTGTGPAAPIVLVPDPPNTIEHYGSLIERLAPGGPVICLDAPGFGFSFPRTGFSYGMEQQADLIAEVLDALDVTAVTLSMGCLSGFVAMILARRRPDLIRRLVLVQMPSCDEALRWVRGGYWWLLGSPFLGQLTMALGKRSVTRMWYGSCLGDEARIDDYLDPSLDMLRRGGTFSLASAFQMFRPDLIEWGGVEQDVTLIWGGADRTHAGTDPRSGLVHLPHAHWAAWPTSGHYPDVEHPDAYARVLRP